MHYITIPVWAFVILVILATLMTLIILFIVCGVLAAFFAPSHKYDETNNCPEEIDSDTIELKMKLEREKEEGQQE